MNLAEALWCLAEGSDLPSINSFGDRQRVRVVEGAPTQSEQLARAKGFGHVQHEQETVPPGSFRQNRRELLPGQNLLVLGPKVLGGPQLARRVFDQEFLLDASSKMDLRYDLACLTLSCEYRAARPFTCVCSMNRSKESSGRSPNFNGQKTLQAYRVESSILIPSMKKPRSTLTHVHSLCTMLAKLKQRSR